MITSPVMYSEIDSGEENRLRKLRDQTSSRNAVLTPCMMRVQKSHSSTRAEQRRHEVDAAAADRVQIARDEAPQHDVDGDPGHHGNRPHRAAAQQIELPQHDAGDGPQLHDRGAHGVDQRLARHADEQLLQARGPVFMRQGLRIALEQHLAVRKEQHPVADRLDLVHVVRGPKNAAAARAPRGS